MKWVERSWINAVLIGVLASSLGCEEPVHQLIEVEVPTRDGSVLAGDLHEPVGGDGPWPTIVVLTPYGRTAYRGAGLPLGASPDYAYLVVDERGRFGSASASRSDATRGEDGYDVVEWVAEQPFSDGHVGMWGPSALGRAQYETARLAPPHLDAIVPLVSGFRLDYETYYPGGVFRESYYQKVLALGFLNSLTVKSFPHRKPPFASAVWDELEESTSFGDEITVPTLVVSGWHDHNTRHVLHAFETVASEDKRLLMGPWTHGNVDSEQVGELEYPEAGGHAERAALAFLDHHLRGIEDPSQRVRRFEMGSNRWIGSDAWPSEPDRESVYFLAGDGGLAANATADGGAVSFVYDPLDPSPTLGGIEDDPLDPTDVPGPRDQSAVESRGDAVVFTTEVLDRSVRLTGAARVHLFVASDHPDTDFVVRLTDVHTDGRSMLVVDGAAKARFRNGFDREDLLEPGEISAIVVELPPTAQSFEPGHRIRVVVTSSNAPRFAPSPNSGEPIGSDEIVPEAAENKIHFGTLAPSRLVLPEMDG